MFENQPEPERLADDLSDWALPGVERAVCAQPSPEVLALTAALDALAAVDLAALAGSQVLAQTKAVLAQAQRLSLLGLAHLAQVEARQLHTIDGASSTGLWVQAQGVDVDATQLAVARRLPAFPRVADAVGDGTIGLAGARTLQTVLARLRPHLDRPDGLVDGQPAEPALRAVIVDGVRMMVAEARGGFPTADDPVLAELLHRLPAVADRPGSQLDRLEESFVLLAAHVEPAQLRGGLALLVDALLPEQHAARVERGHDRRCLRLVREVDGSGWHLQGRLDLQCGERLFTLLQAELAKDDANPLDTAHAAALREQGLDPYDPELGSTLTPRSRGERMHDALDAAADRYLGAGLGGTLYKSPVQVTVVVAAETLDRRPGALPARAGSGASLPLPLARRWACGSVLTRHVVDLPGRVVAASHSGRTLNRAERRMLRTQTGGRCQGAGCRHGAHEPGTVLHPHDADPWARTGSTSLADTVLLCEHCHHDVHDGQRLIRLKDGRRLGPDGWVT